MQKGYSYCISTRDWTLARSDDYIVTMTPLARINIRKWERPKDHHGPKAKLAYYAGNTDRFNLTQPKTIDKGMKTAVTLVILSGAAPVEYL